MTINAWHSDDKIWLKTRKQQWKVLKAFLLKHDPEMRRIIKQSEQYYLYGTPKSAEKIAIILRLWFHPDHSEQNWREMLSVLNKDDRYTVYRMFLDYTDNYEWDDKVPFMGGDEAVLMRLLVGNSLNEYCQLLESKIEKISLQRFENWPNEVSSWLSRAAYGPNSRGGYPYRPITALQEHWIESINHLPLDNPTALKKVLSDVTINKLKFLFRRTHFFIEPRLLSPENSLYAQFCAGFRERIAQVTLPDFLQEIFDDSIKVGNELRGYLLKNHEHYELDESEKWQLLTRAFNSGERINNLLPSIVEAFYERDLIDTPFALEQIQKVDIAGYLDHQCSSIFHIRMTNRAASTLITHATDFPVTIAF